MPRESLSPESHCRLCTVAVCVHVTVLPSESSFCSTFLGAEQKGGISIPNLHPTTSPRQGRWDPDSLRPGLSLGGQATAGVMKVKEGAKSWLKAQHPEN